MPAFNLVAVNDLISPDGLAYLLKFDTVYGRWSKTVTAHDNSLNIDGKDYAVLSAKDPSKLPWREMGVDLVFECTGMNSRCYRLRVQATSYRAGVWRAKSEKPVNKTFCVELFHNPVPGFFTAALCVVRYSRPVKRHMKIYREPTILIFDSVRSFLQYLHKRVDILGKNSEYIYLRDDSFSTLNNCHFILLQYMIWPPFTGMVAPLTKLDNSEARNVTAPATSIGLPSRRKGIQLMRSSR